MLYFILCVLLIPCSSYAVNIEQWKMIPGSEDYRYTLIDLGPTDVPQNMLAKFALPNTMAPQINNAGKVIYNQIQQGYVDEDTPFPMWMNHSYAFCHGLNDKGDILISYGNNSNDIRWSVNSPPRHCTQNSASIDLYDLQGRNVFLRALNNEGLAIGCFKPSGMWRPILWSKDEGLHHLGYFLGWDIKGNLFDINSQGSIVGLMTNVEEPIPFMWSKKNGLIRLSSFGRKWRFCTRKALIDAIHFDDLVIAEDDRVFGAFHSSTEWEEDFVGAFWWDPHTDQVRSLDLKGMHLNAINNQNTLVGNWKGKAALYDLGGSPIILDELISENKHAWELLDASDINDHGDIVGYGKFEGKMHYFILERYIRPCK